MSISIDAIVGVISSAAPVTFLIAIGAGIAANAVASFARRKLQRQYFDAVHDTLLMFEGKESHTGKRVKLTEEELENISLLLASVKMQQAKSDVFPYSKSTGVAVKISEYLSNKEPADSLMKEVAK